MHNILDQILELKMQEVGPLIRQDIVSFAQSLSNKSIIAEIKRASPAKGALADISDPTLLAKQYERSGASAISVLTDQHYFRGSLSDLKQVKQNCSLPILRKDFIMHPMQIVEAYQSGADAVLLIVAVLGGQTQSMIDFAQKLGLDTLIEVHTHDELKLALDTSANIIGVNNRNLNSLQVDLNNSFNLVQHIPKSIIKISESGIHDAHTAHQLFEAGFNALLVGEALVRSASPGELIYAMRH